MLTKQRKAGDIQEDSSTRQWKAKLELGFERIKHGTVLVRRSHQGPLYVQKPFYPEGDELCHTYILHPPAGIVGGDCLSIDINLAKNSQALITTPAATKLYKANPNSCTLSQNIRVKQGASLEWLPQGNIIFNGARAKISTIFYLHKESRLIAWESQCLGRPACHEVFDQGRFQQRFEVWLDGQPLLIDKLCIEAGSRIQSANWGLASFPVSSVLAAYPGNLELLSLINTHIQQREEQCVATLLDSLLLIRCRGKEMDRVHYTLSNLWQVIRQYLLDREACPPRIWNT